MHQLSGEHGSGINVSFTRKVTGRAHLLTGGTESLQSAETWKQERVAREAIRPAVQASDCGKKLYFCPRPAWLGG